MFYTIFHNYFSLWQVYFFGILQNPNPALRKYIEINIPHFISIECLWDDKKSHLIWNINFRHAPNEKVPSLRLSLRIN